jgi:signal transduction histidine kinase/HAMP domain-containing protein
VHWSIFRNSASAILGRMALGTKLLVAPAVGIAALVIVAATAWWGLSWHRSTISTLNDVRFANLQLAMEANAFVQEAQLQVEHALSGPQGAGDVLAKLTKDDLLGKWGSAVPPLEFLISQEGLDPVEREVIAATMDSMRSYIGMVDQALLASNVDDMTARKLQSAFGVLSFNLTKLVSVERELTGRAFEESQTQSRRMLLAFLGLLGLSLAAVLGATLVVTRHVRSRVQAIHTAALQLSAGNLACRAEVSSDDEIGQTARAFNFLVDALARTMSQLQSANTRLSDEMVAILKASQTLSSETDLSRLKARVVELLAGLTGATRVQLISYDADADDWFLSREDEAGGDVLMAVHAAAKAGLVPLSAFAYAQGSTSPLVVDDARADDRFKMDDYFASMACCSLMVVPILNHGTLRAVLIVENSGKPGIFASSPLDVVMLIARQLAISLDNVHIYQDLERRVKQRTSELRQAQSDLVATARRAGMAEIATNVLHNIGNVLNSVTVSANLVTTTIHDSKAATLSDIVALLDDNAADLPGFFARDARAKLVPRYLELLANTLQEERRRVLDDLARLKASVQHIMEIVAMQQSYAGVPGTVIQSIHVRDLVDEALRMDHDSPACSGLTVVKDIADFPELPLDKHRMLLIMVNLIKNAKQAMGRNAGPSQQIRLKVDLAEGPKLRVQVQDEGEGIAPENLTRIFSHGFTTRRDGHGFGLHSCALAAMEMGGKLTAESDGPGRGATFTLEVPVVAVG